MILKEKTKEEFGYEVEKLTKGSKKKVWLKCDYCEKEYASIYKNRVNSNKILDKDCCMGCRQKKKEEVVKIKYGVDNVMKTKSAKENLKKTNQERYGVDYAIQSEQVREKSKKTCVRKYGVEQILSDPSHREKCKNSIKKKYGVDNYMKLDGVAEIASKKAIQTKRKRGLIESFDGLERKDWQEYTGFSKSHFGKLVRKYGWEKAITMSPGMSSLEINMKAILEDIGCEFEIHSKIGKYYCDFKINNIVIECDGLYWHCEENVSNNYHAKKRETYLKEGYTPLFFRENEINEKPEIVKSIIMNKLGKCNRVFARKLNLVELTTKQSSEFYSENHLMGPGRGKTLVLIDNSGEVYSAIQIVKRKGTIYEVSRFCNKNGYTIVGGYSKLLKNFERSTKMTSLFSFTDLRYGTGDHMDKFGFIKTTNYLSFKWTDGKSVWNRMKFPGNKGYELGLFRIYDCGQLRFEKKY